MAGDLIKNKRVVFFLLLLSLILIRLNNEICFDKYPNEISFLLRRIRQSNPKFVEVAGVTLPFIGADPKDPRVPGEEAELVINERTPTLLKYLYTVALDVKQNIHGALIGEAGIGKSALVRYLAYKMQTRFFWVPMQRDTEALDLIGRYVPVVPVCACVPPSSSEDEAPPRESEEWAWIPGQVLKAIEEGGILFLDDVNLARPDQLKFFNSLLDYHSTVFTAYYGGKRHTISIHPNFRIFVAMNPTSYQGRGELGSFLKRFQTHTMEHLPREELEEILTVLVEKAAPDLKKVVKPMLDLYYFMRDNLIKIGQNKEVRSRANGQYYFSMRDLLSMLDYIKEFRNKDEPLADTFGYAAKYVFRDRLEIQIVSEREIEENPRAAYRLYDQFDEFLKSVKVDGKTPNMKKILYYENLDVDEVKAMASKSVLDWLTYLTDEVFPKTNLAKEVKKLIGLLLDDFPERNLAYYPAFTIFPEKMRDKAIEELKNFILDRSSSQMSLVDKFKATEVLIEIAEHIKTAKDSLKAIYQNISRRPIYQDPSLQLLFQAYVGSGLAKYDIEPYANFRSDLQELLISSLLKAPEVLSRKGERGDFILTQLIQSLGWLGIKNERIISSLWDLLNDVQKTPLQRATAAKVLVEMDERLKEIKELFLKLADGKKVEEEKTAGLIAELALNSKMVDQKVRQKLKELSDHTDLEIALSVLDSRLRLQLEREEAETKITQLYTQTAQRSIEERIKVALVMHKYGL
ncbi:MAG: AAA family ATPase, partial [Candidatus Omnitrophica bacterium]|nr:AAA family ATPase [Candidatus Omnitrophota bacterium]